MKIVSIQEDPCGNTKMLIYMQRFSEEIISIVVVSQTHSY